MAIRRFLWLIACCIFANFSLTLAATSLGFEVPSIAWKECGEQLLCGNLTVPLDWSRPDGPRIQLYVNKLEAKAKDSPEHLGTLFFEPGGPGLSGSRDVSQFTRFEGMGLLERYDMVGLDPRSVGFSSPLICDDRIPGDKFPGWPYTQSKFQSLSQRNRKFAQSCVDLSGELAMHVDTASVAKDLEALRAVLGAPKLNLLAFSYGTQLAATYISLFPESVGRILMDGNLDHTTDRIIAFTSEAKTVEACFGRWADWCARNETCTFRSQTQPNTRELFAGLLADIDSGNLKLEFTPNCEPVGCESQRLTGDDIVRVVRGFLYSPDYDWPGLGRALDALQHGDPGPLMSHGERMDKPPKTDPPTNTEQAGVVVTCLDFDYAKSFPQFQQLRELGRSIAPLTRGHLTQSGINNIECTGFPFTRPPDAMQKPLDINDNNVPPVLMVQNTYDPATSYQSALNLQRQIPNSRLLVREGDGHISYRLSGRVRKLVDGFLLNGTMPEQGTRVMSSSMGEGYGT